MARSMTRREALAAFALAGASSGRAFAQAVEEADPWPELKPFGPEAAVCPAS